MKIDFEIAFGFNVDVKKTVAAKSVQHMIKERYAGLDRGLAAAVDIQVDRDVRFFGLALDRRLACHKDSSSLSESRFYRARVIVQPFQSSQMRDFRRQRF